MTALAAMGRLARRLLPAPLFERLRRARRLNRFIPHPLEASRPPMLYNVELTNACPMRCVACPRTRVMTRPVGFMDIGLFKGLIDELAELWPKRPKNDLALHHFGESLLHPRFDEAMRYAGERGFRAVLSCNPLALTEGRAQRLFAAQPAQVILMMDGYDDESFFRARGVKGVYAKSLENALLSLVF